MRLIALLTTCLLALPAHAQRPAVAADLSPEAAGRSFRATVLDACVPAVAGAGVTAMPASQRAGLQPTNDPQTRQQAGAAADESVWNVMDAFGVVTVRDRPGRCAVSVYGPPAGPTMRDAAAQLAGAGFDQLGHPAAGGLVATFAGERGGRRILVRLEASEPGSPGHRSRFTVVTATVFVAH